jgi:hypothetical protein
MIEYEQMKSLFIILKVPNHPSKHWSECVGWEIIQSLHHVVLIAIKKVILALSFQSISINERNTIDNQIWILIHCYVVASWR